MVGDARHRVDLKNSSSMRVSACLCKLQANKLADCSIFLPCIQPQGATPSPLSARSALRLQNACQVRTASTHLFCGHAKLRKLGQVLEERALECQNTNHLGARFGRVSDMGKWEECVT
jgi:hypothetical protein